MGVSSEKVRREGKKKGRSDAKCPRIGPKWQVWVAGGCRVP